MRLTGVRQTAQAGKHDSICRQLLNRCIEQIDLFIDLLRGDDQVFSRKRVGLLLDDIPRLRGRNNAHDQNRNDRHERHCQHDLFSDPKAVAHIVSSPQSVFCASIWARLNARYSFGVIFRYCRNAA